MAQGIPTPAPLMNIELDPWQILTASLAGPGLVLTNFGVLGTQTTGSVRILPLFLGKFQFRKPFVALGALFGGRSCCGVAHFERCCRVLFPEGSML